MYQLVWSDLNFELEGGDMGAVFSQTKIILEIKDTNLWVRSCAQMT